MTRQAPFVIAIIPSLVLTGCFSSVRVTNSKSLDSPPKGIPFYAKTGACKQETVWLEPQYTLAYELPKPALPVEKVLNRRRYLSKEVQTFILTSGDEAKWKDTIMTEPGPDLVDETNPDEIKKEVHDGNWMEASNTGAIEAVVDYSNVFYLNSARPLAGTTQVDAKLGPDGTLTEASAQVNDQTLATVASVVSSLVSSASTAAKILATDGHTETQVPVKVTVKVYKHTHSQYLPPIDSTNKTTITPSACLAASSGVIGGSFVVTDVSDAANAKPADAAKENTITVSGSIVLPKTAAPPPSTTTKPPATGGTTTPPKN
jgi:hypothetical protein